MMPINNANKKHILIMNVSLLYHTTAISNIFISIFLAFESVASLNKQGISISVKSDYCENFRIMQMRTFLFRELVFVIL